MHGRERANWWDGEIRGVGNGVGCFWVIVNMEHQVFDTDHVLVYEDFVASRLAVRQNRPTPAQGVAAPGRLSPGVAAVGPALGDPAGNQVG